jgi:hypothetical protein
LAIARSRPQRFILNRSGFTTDRGLGDLRRNSIDEEEAFQPGGSDSAIGFWAFRLTPIFFASAVCAQPH